jgi:hypothetical protein
VKIEGFQVIEKMERETGLEPATSSLGKRISIVNRGLRRSRRCFLVKEVFCFQWWLSKSCLNEVIKVKSSSGYRRNSSVGAVLSI